MVSTSYTTCLLSTVVALFAAVLHRERSQVYATGRHDRKLFCYYSSYAQNRPEAGKFLPEDINPDLCTHVIFAFSDIDGTRLKASGWNDLENGKDAGLYQRTAALKKLNPRLKVLLAIGGWRAGSAPFVAIVASAESRKTFAANAADFVRRHGFDGLDVDWEFPGSRGSGPEHKELFTLLLKDLRAAFEAESRESGRDRLLLTMAAAGGSYYIELAYETRHITKYVDYLLVMAYNYHGSWNKFTGHHSGLFPRSDEVAGEREWNQAWTIDYWLNKAGAPKEKVIIGISTYGTTFTLANPARHGLKAASTGPGKAGKYTQEPGTLAYYEVCENLRNGWTSVWIDEQKAPYAYQADQWVGYDNVDSVTYKAQYLLKQNAGGAFIWSVEMDDFRGSCGGGKYPLLSAIASVLGVHGSRGRSNAIHFDEDEFFPTRRRSGVEERTRSVGDGLFREDDRRDRPVTRRREPPVYHDDEDYDAAGAVISLRADQTGRSSSRRRHQSSDFDDLRSSRRRPPLTEDVPDTFRRYDDRDASDRRRESSSAADDVTSKRRRWSDGDRRKGLGSSGREARRKVSASDAGWNDHPTSSSTFFDEDSFSSSRRSTRVDNRSRLSNSRGRQRDDDDNTNDENPSCRRSGVFPQPGTNCRSYYVCVQHGTSWHQFFMSCPRGKKFDVSIAACETPASSGYSCEN